MRAPIIIFTICMLAHCVSTFPVSSCAPISCSWDSVEGTRGERLAALSSLLSSLLPACEEGRGAEGRGGEGRGGEDSCKQIADKISHDWKVREARNRHLRSAPVGKNEPVWALPSSWWAGEASWTWSSMTTVYRQPYVLCLDAADSKPVESTSMRTPQSSTSAEYAAQLEALVNAECSGGCSLHRLVEKAKQGGVTAVIDRLDRVAFPGVLINSQLNGILANSQLNGLLKNTELNDNAGAGGQNEQDLLTKYPVVERISAEKAPIQQFRPTEMHASSVLVPVVGTVLVTLVHPGTHPGSHMNRSTFASTGWSAGLVEGLPVIAAKTAAHGPIIADVQSSTQDGIIFAAAECVDDLCINKRCVEETSICRSVDMITALSSRQVARLTEGSALYIPAGYWYSVVAEGAPAIVAAQPFVDRVAAEQLQGLSRFHADAIPEAEGRIVRRLTSKNTFIEHPVEVFAAPDGSFTSRATKIKLSAVNAATRSRSRNQGQVSFRQGRKLLLETQVEQREAPNVVSATPMSVTLQIPDTYKTLSGLVALLTVESCGQPGGTVRRAEGGPKSPLMQHAKLIADIHSDNSLAHTIARSKQAVGNGATDLEHPAKHLEMLESADALMLNLDGNADLHHLLTATRWVDAILDRNITGNDTVRALLEWHLSTLSAELSATASWLHHSTRSMCNDTKPPTSLWEDTHDLLDRLHNSDRTASVLEAGSKIAGSWISRYLYALGISLTGQTSDSEDANWQSSSALLRTIWPTKCPRAVSAQTGRRCVQVVGLAPGTGYRIRVLENIDGKFEAGEVSDMAWTSPLPDFKNEIYISNVSSHALGPNSVNVTWLVENVHIAQATYPLLGFLIEVAIATGDARLEFREATVAELKRHSAGWFAVINNVPTDLLVFKVRAICAFGVLPKFAVSLPLDLGSKTGKNASIAYISPSGEIVRVAAKGNATFDMHSTFSVRSYPEMSLPTMMAKLLTHHSAVAIAHSQLAKEVGAMSNPAKLIRQSGLGAGALMPLLRHSAWGRHLANHGSSLAAADARSGSKHVDRALRQLVLMFSDPINSTATLDLDKQIAPGVLLPCAQSMLLAGVGGLQNFVNGRETRLTLLAAFLGRNQTEWAPEGVRWVKESITHEGNENTTCTDNSWIAALYKSVAHASLEAFAYLSVNTFAAQSRQLASLNASNTGDGASAFLDADQDVILVHANGMPHEIPAWYSAWSGTETVNASLAAAIPFNGLAADNSLHVLNGDALRGRISIIERGHFPLARKVEMLAEQGAIAVIIVDDAPSRCHDNGFNDKCVAGSDLSRGEGFGYSDDPQLWTHARIPAALITRESGARLLEYMHGS